MSYTIYLNWPVKAVLTAAQERYREAITQEIIGFSADKNTPVQACYIRVADPDTLLQTCLLDTVGILNNRFLCTDQTEITLEVDSPAELSLQHLQRASQLGVNRLCVPMRFTLKGIQIDAIPAGTIALAAAWFTNVSVDVRITHLAQAALVGATIASWPITHISLDLSSVLERSFAASYLTLQKEFEIMGFARYEWMHFAKKGFASRYQQARWAGLPCKGFGAGAWSQDQRLRRQNAPHWMRYCNQMRAAGNAICFAEQMSMQQEVYERIMHQIRTIEGVSIPFLMEAVREAGNEEALKRAITALVEKDFMVNRDGSLALTMKGFCVENHIIKTLFALVE